MLSCVLSVPNELPQKPLPNGYLSVHHLSGPTIPPSCRPYLLNNSCLLSAKNVARNRRRHKHFREACKSIGCKGPVLKQPETLAIFPFTQTQWSQLWPPMGTCSPLFPIRNPRPDLCRSAADYLMRRIPLPCVASWLPRFPSLVRARRGPSCLAVLTDSCCF